MKFVYGTLFFEFLSEYWKIMKLVILHQTFLIGMNIAIQPEVKQTRINNAH